MIIYGLKKKESSEPLFALSRDREDSEKLLKFLQGMNPKYKKFDVYFKVKRES